MNMSNEKQWRHAAFVVMGLPTDGRNQDTVLAVRATLDDALAAQANIVRERIKQGWSHRGCAMYVQPTEEQVEVIP